MTLPVAPAKPTVPLGPFGEGSKAPASFCRHGALQGTAELPGATDPRGLWDVPPPGQLLYGALPPGYPCGQKLTGMVHGGEHRAPHLPVGCREEIQRHHSCGTGLCCGEGQAQPFLP